MVRLSKLWFERLATVHFFLCRKGLRITVDMRGKGAERRLRPIVKDLGGKKKQLESSECSR